MPKRLFDRLTLFGRTWLDVTLPTGPVRATQRRYAVNLLDVSDPPRFRDEAVVTLHELLNLGVRGHFMPSTTVPAWMRGPSSRRRDFAVRDVPRRVHAGYGGSVSLATSTAVVTDTQTSGGLVVDAVAQQVDDVIATLAPLDSAQQEQNQHDDQYQPDDARGTVTIRVITPAGQTTKQEQKQDDQQYQSHGGLPPLDSI
jgi:hypothetical protein